MSVGAAAIVTINILAANVLTSLHDVTFKVQSGVHAGRIIAAFVDVNVSLGTAGWF